MPRNIIQYDLLISCPDDIRDELPLIEKAVEEFNTMFSDALGISIRTKHWSKNAYAQSGGKPQALLNEQFVNDCDAAVALFWTRFGTPTDQYGSGTEEEIELMLGSGKQVFMYFSDKPINPSLCNAEEYARVQAFRKKYADRGLYFNYASNEQFSTLFFAHLSQHFISEKRVSEVRAERMSKLSICGIDGENKLSETAVYQPMKLNTDRTSIVRIEEIKRMYAEIADIHLVKATGLLGNAYFSVKKPAEVNASWINVIKECAEALGIELAEGFFCVGNLVKDVLSGAAIVGRPQFEGTPDEKRKYNLIQSLYHNIIEACDWIDVEAGFDKIMCVKLALCNTGTMADDEIDVTIRIPKRYVMTLDELPRLKNGAMQYLTREYNLCELMGISSTAEYTDYDSAMMKQPQAFKPRRVPVLPGFEDYEEDYENELRDVFCFDLFSDGDDYVIKLRFDHLKHHNTAAFPAALLMKDKPEVLSYTITSKNSAEVVKGEIRVE